MKSVIHMKSCVLICNLESGKGIKEKDIELIKNLITKNGYKVKLHITKKENDATIFVQNMPYCDLVLSIGGDGTFNEVVTGNFKRKEKLVLSHIPVGTTNDIGNMLGMSKNIIKNVQDILNGEIKQVDIGLINNNPFVYVAGFGKFINVPYETNRKFKKKFGHLAYLINGAKEFFQKTRLYELEYEIDGKTYHGLYSLILISNATRIAGFNNIYKDVKLDDNKLEITFCNLTRRGDLAKSIIMLLTHDITTIPGIYCHRTNEITIKFKKRNKLHWTIDGEKLKDEKLVYHITVNKNIKMLLPKKNLNNLFKN